MVIDSIQTIYTELLQSAPGAVAQVRESAAQLVRFAKQTNTALFLVGHVTKEGTLAGPECSNIWWIQYFTLKATPANATA